MPKSENPILGNIKCDCGHSVTVSLQKGRNRKGYFGCGCYEKAVLTAEKTEEFFPAAPSSDPEPEVKNAKPSRSSEASDNGNDGDTADEPAPAVVAEQPGTDWGVNSDW